MKHERASMKEVVEFYENGVIPRGLKSNNKVELEVVLEVLQYGFGSRVRSLIEGTFPRLRVSFPKDRWEKIGREFTSTFASSESRLDLLPLRFRNFIKGKRISRKSDFFCEIDYAHYLSSQLPYDPEFSVGSLGDILSQNIRTQNSLVFITSNGTGGKGFTVVSRNLNEFFYIEIDKHQWTLLKRLGSKATLENALGKLELSEEILGKFLANCIRYHWLKLSPD